MIKRLRIIVFAAALITWTGCGVQFWLIHKNTVLQQRVANDIKKLEYAKRQLDEADVRVKQETEHLSELLNLLPPKPVPDFRSKL